MVCHRENGQLAAMEIVLNSGSHGNHGNHGEIKRCHTRDAAERVRSHTKISQQEIFT